MNIKLALKMNEHFAESNKLSVLVLDRLMMPRESLLTRHTMLGDASCDTVSFHLKPATRKFATGPFTFSLPRYLLSARFNAGTATTHRMRSRKPTMISGIPFAKICWRRRLQLPMNVFILSSALRFIKLNREVNYKITMHQKPNDIKITGLNISESIWKSNMELSGST
ncbi:hypothetical protein [Paraburkholderia kururiensis]|uniref:hypothetical protein n=1 Tax=Paraburkholderia kururiensis TaxID=984307 RepID=UPI000F898D85|nr:hypothetical protein [Paraburkholderia kururiensis]